MKLRVASFNLENLFSRARILNLVDQAKATELLGQVAQLNQLIGKTAYSAADKREILRLTDVLKNYIEIREDMGKLFSMSNGQKRVSASGKGSWSGVIEFKRAEISEMARESTVAVIKSLKADVLCVVEAEDRVTLQDFNTNGLKTAKFDQVMCIDGNDRRGIDVGLLSEHPITEVRPHVYDGTSTSRTFSRDCPEYSVDLPGGKKLHVLCNHFVSKMNGDPPEKRARRRAQASAVATILKRYDLQTEFVVVAGDMNDTPDSGPMQPLVSLPDLHDVLALQFGQDMSARWTYKFGQQLNQIDYVLVSTPLKNAFRRAGVERRGIHGVQQITQVAPFPTVTGHTTAASDHGAVWAEFDV